MDQVVVNALGLGLIAIRLSDIASFNHRYVGGVHGCLVGLRDGRWFIIAHEEAARLRAFAGEPGTE